MRNYLNHLFKKERDLELLVTLWPTFPHFRKFATDERLAGIRLNTAMIKAAEIGTELKDAQALAGHVPLYFDIKGRQLRVMEVVPNNDHLEVILNHPIEARTPTMVLFKGGEDYALLNRIEGGKRLVFEGGSQYMVYRGESLHIKDPSYNMIGPTFLDYEIEKIEKAKAAGFDRYYLSFVESQKDVDQFREIVGDSEIVLKIESKKGLQYVMNEYRKQKNVYLCAARGDLYVEIDKPHHMMEAMKLIIAKDPEAVIGSRMLLSVINHPVPAAADLSELSWIYDIGYRKMLLCDELCLDGDKLGRAVNVLESFRKDYAGEGRVHPEWFYS
ncbi:TPA: hypothetical protein HA239_03270 [Candidatus Woesearchaeota archaeon]|nr:hypothetical protein QT06_C0001G0062 [archaeon GW2011_AR15]MBS3104131.1 hypothetical protein [Candidatus Woesearchaeota archaeon]HIH41411.1 hypothetical protein [Candidatus Woesearchaeota archaeon]